MTKFMKKSVKGIVSAVLCATMIGGNVRPLLRWISEMVIP